MPDAWMVSGAALAMLTVVIIRDGLSRNWTRMIARGGPLAVFIVMYGYFQMVPVAADDKAPFVRWALIALFTAWTADTTLYLVDRYRHHLAARWRAWIKTKS